MIHTGLSRRLCMQKVWEETGCLQTSQETAYAISWDVPTYGRTITSAEEETTEPSQRQSPFLCRQQGEVWSLRISTVMGAWISPRRWRRVKTLCVLFWMSASASEEEEEEEPYAATERGKGQSSVTTGARTGRSVPQGTGSHASTAPQAARMSR